MYHHDKMSLLRQIQAMEFAGVEFQLYLDNFPNDQRALADFAAVAQNLDMLKRTYESMYGPLLSYGFSPNNANTWQWVQGPWPWEIEY